MSHLAFAAETYTSILPVTPLPSHDVLLELFVKVLVSSWKHLEHISSITLSNDLLSEQKGSFTALQLLAWLIFSQTISQLCKAE